MSTYYAFTIKGMFLVCEFHVSIKNQLLTHEKLELTALAQVRGYIYIYLSNESNAITDVYFDDLQINHTGAYVTQATDYGVWGDVIREQMSDESVYRFGYQGQFAEKDEETGWNHFELRQYDPIIGRWLIPDPYRQYWSPYLAMGNNPVNRTDPDGGCDGPDCPPKLHYDKNGDPWYLLGELTTTGEWTEQDESALDDFVKAMNKFGAWLEETMNLPKGEGIMFYSTDGGGPLYHVRNGDATYSIVDPGSALIVFHSKVKYFPKGHVPSTNTASDIIEVLEESNNVLEAFDKMTNAFGNRDEAIRAIHNVVNGPESEPSVPYDTGFSERKYREGYKVLRTYLKSSDSTIRMDTTWLKRDD